MKRWMRPRKPSSVSILFIRFMVDLAWNGRFTMKRIEGMKEDDFSVAQPGVYGR